MDKKDKLIVITAPSGAGKTTIAKRLLQEFREKLSFSISATNRERRPDEVDGRDYHYMGGKEFFRKIGRGEFLEWEEVYTQTFYGTLKSEIFRIHELGKAILLDINVKGALHVQEMFGDNVLTLFIKPPAPELIHLKKRLDERKDSTIPQEKLGERLSKAPSELAAAPLFDYIIINDDLEHAIREAKRYVAEFLA